MAQDIIAITAEKVVDSYKKIGKTAEQIAALEFELSSTPLSGTIARFVEEPKEFTPEGSTEPRKYFVYEVIDENGKVTGELSVNRAFDSYVEQGKYVIVSNVKSTNKDKAMLKSIPMNDLTKFGKSRAQQIAGLVGTKYTAEKQEKNVITLYTPEKMFTPKIATGKAPTEAHLTALWKNTSPKSLLKFNFE